jgi:hypothetical protein
MSEAKNVAEARIKREEARRKVMQELQSSSQIPSQAGSPESSKLSLRKHWKEVLVFCSLSTMMVLLACDLWRMATDDLVGPIP